METSLIDAIRSGIAGATVVPPAPVPAGVPSATPPDYAATIATATSTLDQLADLRAAAEGELLSLEGEFLRRADRVRWQLSVPASLRPLLSPSRYKGAYGGRGGAKSHFFAEQLVRKANERPALRIVCIREVQKSLEQSAKRLIADKIEALGLGDHFRVLNTHIETPGGGIILFQGMQSHTAESMKSLEGFDLAWVEEAQSLSQASLDLLRPTIRKDGSELWFSWNPREPTDPVDAFFRAHEADAKLSPPPNTICVRTSFRDNPYLPEVLRAEIEWDRGRDIEKYTHVWEGGYRKRSAASVFKNWRVEDLGPRPAGVPALLGGDWGFAVDPDVLLSAWLHPSLPRTLIIDHEVWEIGCEIEDTPDLWDGLYCDGACPAKRSDCQRPSHGEARRYAIVGDSARPETISHMKRHGYPKLEPARKGPNSVEEGIVFLQSYDIIVHPRCAHVIDELTFYSYKTDSLTGRVLPVLEDKKNHTVDSLRYAVEPVRRDAKPKVKSLW